ncbi:M24 family metallopeptidase [Haloarcula onubensis]|uniref:M24 family metallopeptidase n=1 Tax=Haloarcula onubensis TaxID=2950539 RepID=A0ABU2FVH9_9EURY|nr:M24 family metallopeptidase [Halomicroarcula sp. S3CR25-11]MDS0284242.1 M24 family metallopeptidase [Halomicroarcula sp. S3CR25-11]
MSVTARLDAYLERNDLAAVWFARPNSFAWLTGATGRPADNVVDRGGDIGVAAAGYDGDGVTVVTDTIEGPRLREEELADGVAVETYTWYEGDLGSAVAEASPTPAAADFEVPGFATVDASALRQPLTETQRERYRDLGAEVAAAVERVARRAAASDTERSVAADLRGELAEAGVDSPVALVGGGQRAQRYRHYTPKPEPLGDYALLSVTAERDGLYTSCTRTVAFDAPEWLRERTQEAMRVEATALAATRAVGRDGGTAGDVFEAVQDAYEAVGWADEWRNHHQGGAAGYAGREWVATPDSDERVVLPQAYAWNPTVRGAKSEDTHLVTGDGVELLSGTGEWPTERVDAVGYDETVPRHGVLDI